MGVSSPGGRPPGPYGPPGESGGEWPSAGRAIEFEPREGTTAKALLEPKGLLELDSAVLKGFWVEAVEYALSEISRYARWRAQGEPVLPDGYDAESVVQAAFGRLLTRQSRDVPILYSEEDIRRELRSLIKHRVRWLHERRETSLVSYEWDVLPPTVDGELRSVLEPLPSHDAKPDEELMQKEKEELLAKFKESFEETLSRRGKLLEVFRLIWDGQKRRHIAQRIGVGVEVVKALQAQLGRRLRKFGERTRGAVAEMVKELVNG